MEGGGKALHSIDATIGLVLMLMLMNLFSGVAGAISGEWEKCRAILEKYEKDHDECVVSCCGYL